MSLFLGLEKYNIRTCMDYLRLLSLEGTLTQGHSLLRHVTFARKANKKVGGWGVKGFKDLIWGGGGLWVGGCEYGVDSGALLVWLLGCWQPPLPHLKSLKSVSLSRWISPTDPVSDHPD